MNELFLLEESVNSENFTTLPFHPTPALMSASGLLFPTPPQMAFPEIYWAFPFTYLAMAMAKWSWRRKK